EAQRRTPAVIRVVRRLRMGSLLDASFVSGPRRLTGSNPGQRRDFGVDQGRRFANLAGRQERVLKAFHSFVAAGIVAAAATAPAIAADISGAGSTFAYPIYSKWAEAYKKETGSGVNYQPIGSGDGITQIQNKEGTFAASDMPPSVVDLDTECLFQFPTLTAGVVPVVNIDGIKPGDLVLDGSTLARIFLGEIKSWNDAAIRRLNPNVKLPSEAIRVVYRSDGSGTTFVFTDYLG